MNNTKITSDASAKCVEVNVKWYNPAKGYGFLNEEGSTEDIMIHFSVLDAIKCPYIKPGDRVVCEVVAGRSGLQALRVIEVKYGSPETRSLATAFSARLTPEILENLKEIEGTIKWYNHDKGYGFICPNDGTSEIFVHFSVVREAGYKFLEPGTQVLAKISQSDRGPEARMIRVLHAVEEEPLKVGFI